MSTSIVGTFVCYVVLNLRSSSGLDSGPGLPLARPRNHTILVMIWSLWSWLSLGGLAYSIAFRNQQLYHGQLKKKKRQSADIRLPPFRADSETVEKSVSIFVREIITMLSSWGSQLKPLSTCRKLGITSATRSFFSLKCDYNIMRKLFKTNKKFYLPVAEHIKCWSDEFAGLFSNV